MLSLTLQQIPWTGDESTPSAAARTGINGNALTGKYEENVGTLGYNRVPYVVCTGTT